MLDPQGLYQSYSRAVEVTEANQVVASADPRRVCIVFWRGLFLGDISVAPGSFAAATDGPILGSFGTTEFYWSRHGPVVQESWICTVSTPPYTLKYLETIFLG